MRSKRVARQLKKTFGDDSLEDHLPRLLQYVDTLPDHESRQCVRQIVENMGSFLDLVEESYGQFEERANVAQRSLEVSSQELTVANKELFSLNRTFDAMVNSLGQGFLLFGPDGICLPTYSKACEQLLECRPVGQHIATVLKVPDNKRGTFEEWSRICFNEIIEFEDAVALGQATFPHSQGLMVTLDYRAVRDNEGKIAYMVLIATDRTEEFKARKMAEEMHNYATLVVSILKDKEKFRCFIHEAKKIILAMHECVAGQIFDADILKTLKRHLHTLKGASASFGLANLKEYIHQVETKLSDVPGLDAARELLVGAVPRVEALFESVLSENRAILGEEFFESIPKREFTLDFLAEFASRIRVDQRDRECLFETFVDEFLGVPASKVFSRYEADLQQTARRLNKTVAPIHFVSGDIRILPEQYDPALSSLIHVFRNIADHGIELPEVRRQRGKDPMGQVQVAFQRTGTQANPTLEVKISDDGNGIDVERIRARIRERDPDWAERAGPAELMDRIFDSGLSTSATVTDISGRGVGLDAVRTAISQLGGSIRVDSCLGKGTTFTINLPVRGFDQGAWQRECQDTPLKKAA